MAITNASDLLVYRKTTASEAQVYRVYVKASSPLQTLGNFKINNVTSDTGSVSDNNTTANVTSNTGAGVIPKITTVLVNKGYSATSISSVTLNGVGYSFIEYTTGITSIVPIIEIVEGTAVLESNDNIIVEVKIPGSSATFDPVAFSTSASFNSSVDTIDVTTKDSLGDAEFLPGQKSFEVSTDVLQSVNPDIPLEGTDFFHELNERDEVNVRFSDRIINIILTKFTSAGIPNFTKSNNLTQLVNVTDPFGTLNASKLTTSASTSSEFLRYTIVAATIENKKVNWSFYVKGSGSTNSASFQMGDTTVASSSTVTILEGPGTVSAINSLYFKVENLSTSQYTRISFQTDTINSFASSSFSAFLYPGIYTSQDSDEIITSSWQIETSSSASSYQDPSKVKSYEGNAIVTSISYDAGVEDSVTCSATFTGTGTVTLNE